MDCKEIELRKKLQDDFEFYAKTCLKIRSKEASIEPFILNKAQKYIHVKLEEQKALTGKVRALILKGRQQGCSTYIAGRFYKLTTYSFGTQAFILTHALDATQNLFKMAQRFHEHTPDFVKPSITKSNIKELAFGSLDSGYKIGTAENKAVGRSSTIQLFHGSETAFWSNASEHAKGIIQAVPNAAGTEIIFESTANGVGNFFHQEWQKAEDNVSDYIAIFVPWFWQDEYKRPIDGNFELTPEEFLLKEQYFLSDEQISWRRAKIIEFSVSGMDGTKAFHQEYPCCSTEAFLLTGEDHYISPDLVMKARKGTAQKLGKLIIGVDPARFGDDRTAIIRRIGRVAYNLEKYSKKDTMEVVGILHNIILRENPFRVLIDVGGLGAGIVDRLYELGHKKIVTPVNFGSQALDSIKYANKRAEIWGSCKEWLLQEPCQIPDDDSLHADLCNPKYKVDSNGRLLMEKKEEMKKRGIRSPDGGDALCLTFALPDSAYFNNATDDEITAKSMMSGFNRVRSSRNNMLIQGM